MAVSAFWEVRMLYSLLVSSVDGTSKLVEPIAKAELLTHQPDPEDRRAGGHRPDARRQARAHRRDQDLRG